MEHTLWMLQKLLWPVNLIGSALVAWRLYSLDLHRKYRFFFLVIVVQVARSVSLLPFDYRTQIYYEMWLWTEPVLWLSYILVVYELYLRFPCDTAARLQVLRADPAGGLL
jgi:hypothetical protein